MDMGPLVKYSVCLLILCSLYISLDAQNVVGLRAPVGTYQYQGPRGEKEFISSVGGAKVGVFRRVVPPRYRIRIPLLARPLPPVRPPTKKPPPPKKPTGVGYRQGGILGGLLPGVLGGLLGGR